MGRSDGSGRCNEGCLLHWPRQMSLRCLVLALVKNHNIYCEDDVRLLLCKESSITSLPSASVLRLPFYSLL